MFQVLIAALTAVASWILPRLLSVAGTVVVSQTVITPIFTYLQNTITAKLGGMSADAVNFFQFVGVPEAISVIFAAYSLAIGIRSAKAAFQRSGARGA
jgi:hypothetical protein